MAIVTETTRYTLELSEEEALVLADLSGRVLGTQEGTYRGVTDGIYAALEEALGGTPNRFFTGDVRATPKT